MAMRAAISITLVVAAFHAAAAFGPKIRVPQVGKPGPKRGPGAGFGKFPQPTFPGMPTFPKGSNIPKKPFVPTTGRPAPAMQKDGEYPRQRDRQARAPSGSKPQQNPPHVLFDHFESLKKQAPPSTVKPWHQNRGPPQVPPPQARGPPQKPPPFSRGPPQKPQQAKGRFGQSGPPPRTQQGPQGRFGQSGPPPRTQQGPQAGARSGLPNHVSDRLEAMQKKGREQGPIGRVPKHHPPKMDALKRRLDPRASGNERPIPGQMPQMPDLPKPKFPKFAKMQPPKIPSFVHNMKMPFSGKKLFRTEM